MSGHLERLSAELEGRYRVKRILGAGGVATVYLAHDVKHDRRVAVKVLHPELAAIIGGERFLPDIRTTAQLHHSYILPLFDSGEADSLLYYVMPYLEGESLPTRLTCETQLPIVDGVHIECEVASALDYAHRAAGPLRELRAFEFARETRRRVCAPRAPHAGVRSRRVTSLQGRGAPFCNNAAGGARPRPRVGAAHVTLSRGRHRRSHRFPRRLVR